MQPLTEHGFGVCGSSKCMDHTYDFNFFFLCMRIGCLVVGQCRQLRLIEKSLEYMRHL